MQIPTIHPHENTDSGSHNSLEAIKNDIQIRYRVYRSSERDISVDVLTFLASLAHAIQQNSKGTIDWEALATMQYTNYKRLFSSIFGEYQYHQKIAYGSYFTDKEWQIYYNWIGIGVQDRVVSNLH